MFIIKISKQIENKVPISYLMAELTPGQPKKNAENIYVYNILGFVFADPQTEVAQTV